MHDKIEKKYPSITIKENNIALEGEELLGEVMEFIESQKPESNEERINYDITDEWGNVYSINDKKYFKSMQKWINFRKQQKLYKEI